MRKPLQGICVLDLTAFVSGPVCGRLLSDLGAEVIKVERPQGDAWREVGKSYNKRFNDDQNPVFDIYNTGKKMIALDLKAENGKAIFWKLLKQSDVFVTNMRSDALKRLGFSYEDVKKECPRLIYAMASVTVSRARRHLCRPTTPRRSGRVPASCGTWRL